MPYKDQEARKRAARDSMARKRHVNPSQDVNPSVNPQIGQVGSPVNPDVNPSYPGEPWNSPGWNPTHYLAWYIQQPFAATDAGVARGSPATPTTGGSAKPNPQGRPPLPFLRLGSTRIL